MCVFITPVALVHSDYSSQFGAALVRRACHEGSNSRSKCPARFRVIRQASGHKKGTQVGVSDSQLTVFTGGVTNGIGREISETDGNIHSRDDKLHCLRKTVGIKCVVILEELEQVEAREVARGVVQAHVFRAWIGRIDTTGFWIGMPVINSVVVLNTRICTCPRGLCHFMKQLRGIDSFHDSSVGTCSQSKGLTILHSLHK